MNAIQIILTIIRLQLSRNVNIIDYDNENDYWYYISDVLDDSALSCFEKTVKTQVEFDKVPVDLMEYDKETLICKFNFDGIYLHILSGNLLTKFEKDAELTWFCRSQNISLICDGSSICLTDECGCLANQTEVFYCSDGSGCVTFDKLCDDIQDCVDGSDECYCLGHIVFSEISFSPNKICLSVNALCNSLAHYNLMDLISVEFEKTNCKPHFHMNPLYECLYEALETMDVEFYLSPELIPPYCKANCSHIDGFFDDKWIRFCDQIIRGNTLDYEFQCDNRTKNHHLSLICDGKIDCTSGYDEIGCPGRFYCSPNEKPDIWIDIDKACDHIKDCSNGADECGTCKIEYISSSEFLIQSKFVLFFTGIQAMLIIILNSIQMRKCWNMSCTSNILQIEKLYLINIFFHDWIMGIYLGGIIIAALVIQYLGKYCHLERTWRSSWACSVFGVTFSSSAHGSLLTIALMSFTRYRVCRTIGLHIRQRYVVIAIVITNMVNWFHSILPLLPITEIQEVFRTEIFFKNLDQNPFFASNPINRTRLLMVYEGMFHKGKGTQAHIYKILEDLKNITSNEEIFDTEEISYYGNTGLCIHNIFKSHGSYEIYQIVYCISLLIVLGIVSTTYMKILTKQRKLKKILADIGGTVNIQGHIQERTSITLKIALMIGSQLICWISFIFTVILLKYILKKPASPLVFEVFALVVIPLNSLLNPVFHGELYKKVMLMAWKLWRSLVNYIS